MIKRTTRTISPQNRQQRRTIAASTGISAARPVTANARTRSARRSSVVANIRLTPEQQRFANQLRSNMRRGASVMAATNTSNIMARPDFLELLPMFVQKLIITDVMGSVAMRSRQQLVPYFKFIAENTKGETPAGTVLSSPFVNRQGQDPNFTGRVVKNELKGDGEYHAM